MTYNKKQMQPLINKYGINPETNKLFNTVCEMFDTQTNYQIWAVRMIFSQAMTFAELDSIHKWIQENSNLISKLQKQNIVSYTTKSAIKQLFKEIAGAEYITFIKSMISHFNTEQRKILTETILGGDVTPLNAYSSSVIKKWYKVFKDFNKKPMNIKNKFYSTSSAIKNPTALHQAILDCLNESYIWKEGKEDLLAYIEHNTPDCEVVFNEGSCVIVRVPSFESSHKLCGSGRTGWCIAREESYFSSYVTNYSNRSQYFLFDFSRKECDAFSHIGFTVEGGRGIIEAQTAHNYPMCSSPFTQGNESLTIHDVLRKFGVNMSTLIRLPNDIGFDWNLDYFLRLVKKHPHAFAIAYNENSRLILNVLDYREFHTLLSKTYLDVSSFASLGEGKKLYLFLDFNVPLSDHHSLYAMLFMADTYGDFSLARAENAFGSNSNDARKHLLDVGIQVSDFLGQENINPSILLHKYIDLGNEAKALELIEKERGNIDVNYEFRQRIPVFSAMNHKMPKLFEAIINCEGFEPQTEYGFGETVLETLLFLKGSNDVTITADEDELLTSMISSVFACKNIDLNVKDFNKNTAINVACEYPKTLWVVEKLVKDRNIDVNAINDFNCGTVSNCITEHNLEALKLIGQRPDLIVRDSDVLLAKENGINLLDYIKPNEDIFESQEENVLEMAFSEKYSAK